MEVRDPSEDGPDKGPELHPAVADRPGVVGRGTRRVLAASEPVTGVVARISTDAPVDDEGPVHQTGPAVDADVTPELEVELDDEPAAVAEVDDGAGAALDLEPQLDEPFALEEGLEEALEEGEEAVEVDEEAAAEAAPEPDEPAGDEPELFGDDYEALVRGAEATLDAVDRALVRLGEGAYGTCEDCGGAIEDDLLAVDPTTATCERHLRPTPAPAEP
ncbi:MAG: TraR/DksA family transcriptional regulator [Acidimicrobiales bacterium]